MDLPLVSFELKENYLLVVGHGTRDNLASMTEASALIYDKAREVKARCLLVDYRKLKIKVHMSEAFNIVKRYEVAQPELKNLMIAGVFDAKGLEFGKFWKEVAIKRGFQIEIFEDYNEAEKWLLKEANRTA